MAESGEALTLPPGMRLVALSFLSVFALFAGCAAQTKLYDRQTGKLVMATGADADEMRLGADGSWYAKGLNQSTPTLAAGTADAKRLNAVPGVIMATGAAAATLP